MREVAWRTWREGRVLDLALAPSDDWELDRDAFTLGYDAVVERTDWSVVGESTISGRELDGPLRENAWRGSERAARRGVARLCVRAGAVWSPRRSVGAVEQLRDGRVLAALDGVQLELWRESGERAWAVTDVGAVGGQRIDVGPDEAWAWATESVRRDRPAVPGEGAVRYSVRDGRPLERLDVGFPAVLMTRSDGSIALRDVRMGLASSQLVLFPPGPGSTEAGRVELSGFEPYSLDLPVRHATAFYLMQNEGDRHHPDPWIAVVESGADGQAATVRRLFRFAWDTVAQDVTRDAPFYSGPAVELNDATGPALVHAVTLRGPLPRAFLARRRLPDGSPNWVAPVEHPVAAVESDTEGGTVYAGLVSGDVVAFDARTGFPRWQRRLAVHGHPVVPLSLSCALPGRLLVGTADGRILDCSTTAA
ncbi:hypothetical protein AB0J84_20595 [Micromonospora arborensis]|uniref:hypothetical protein n=1 Tax=Micromonospora arborensis TaxID=2116518 RepID=UPI003427D34A